MPGPGFREIEHTADWAIHVRATSPSELFVVAAQGMFSLLTELDAIEVDRELEIELEAIDRETLLIDWLNELLYLAEEHDLVFSRFEVELSDTNEGVSLRGRAGGGKPSELKKTIKAATFSSLAIHEAGDGLEAELVFDV